MDYEKAYKAVLQTATQWIKDGCSDKEKICLQSVFPELRESEDEMIREGLIRFITISSASYIAAVTGIEKESYLAYLEKQKEQKPVEIHIDNPNIQKFDPDVKITTSDSSASGKELLYVSNKSYKIGYRDGVNSVRPAEWSEEDEKMIDIIVSVLGQYIDYKEVSGTGSGYAIPRYSKEIGWLKSLRPSWKPSEEQMEAFRSYIKDFQARAEAAVGGWNNFDVMIRLFEQLKKL